MVEGAVEEHDGRVGQGRLVAGVEHPLIKALGYDQKALLRHPSSEDGRVLLRDGDTEIRAAGQTLQEIVVGHQEVSLGIAPGEVQEPHVLHVVGGVHPRLAAKPRQQKAIGGRREVVCVDEIEVDSNASGYVGAGLDVALGDARFILFGEALYRFNELETELGDDIDVSGFTGNVGIKFRF